MAKGDSIDAAAGRLESRTRGLRWLGLAAATLLSAGAGWAVWSNSLARASDVESLSYKVIEDRSSIKGMQMQLDRLEEHSQHVDDQLFEIAQAIGARVVVPTKLRRQP
jgi:hypothetical protein